MSIDYSLNGGATWTTAPATNVVVNPNNNTFVLTVPGGAAAATYAAGQIMVRDTYAPTVTAAAGRWVVSTFNPAAVGSGTLIFGCEVANPNCVAFDSNGNVNKLIDIGGSGRYLTLGPTADQVTPGVVPPGAGVLGGTPVGPPAAYTRLGGADNTRSILSLTPTQNSGIFDPTSNFFDAGPLGGPNDALIQLVNTTNLEIGSWTIVFAAYLSVTASPAKYLGGPIWGQWYSTGGQYVQYVSAGRWHNGNFAAQINDTGTSTLINNNISMSSSQWIVCSAQKNLTNLQWRINKGSWNTAAISSTEAFTSVTFSYGGSLITSINMQSGNSYPYLGDLYCYTGALNSTDLGNVESMVGNSIGLSI